MTERTIAPKEIEYCVNIRMGDFDIWGNGSRGGERRILVWERDPDEVPSAENNWRNMYKQHTPIDTRLTGMTWQIIRELDMTSSITGLSGYSGFSGITGSSGVSGASGWIRPANTLPGSLTDHQKKMMINAHADAMYSTLKGRR